MARAMASPRLSTKRPVPNTVDFNTGVGTLDGWSYAGATGMLLTVAAAASWLPARRASRVDPAEVMRAE